MLTFNFKFAFCGGEHFIQAAGFLFTQAFTEVTCVGILWGNRAVGVFTEGPESLTHVCVYTQTWPIFR